MVIIHLYSTTSSMNGALERTGLCSEKLTIKEGVNEWNRQGCLASIKWKQNNVDVLQFPELNIASLLVKPKFQRSEIENRATRGKI